jgi:putative hydrolase of the HAD superfamily
MEIKSVIFDNDGTLYQLERRFIDDIVKRMVWYLSNELQMTEDEVRAERKRLINMHGIQSTEVVFAREYGLDMNELIRQTYLAVDISKYGNGFRERLNDFLCRISVPKSILTNNPSQFAYRVLSHLGVADLFEHIIGSEELELQLKPRVEAFYRALEITGYNPKTTIFIDDNPEFLVGAKEAGLKTVLIEINGGKFPQADYVLRRIEDIQYLVSE